MLNGDAAGAEREFQECLRIDPNFAEAHYNLGLVLASRRRWGAGKKRRSPQRSDCNRTTFGPAGTWPAF